MCVYVCGLRCHDDFNILVNVTNNFHFCFKFNLNQLNSIFWTLFFSDIPLKVIVFSYHFGGRFEYNGNFFLVIKFHLNELFEMGIHCVRFVWCAKYFHSLCMKMFKKQRNKYFLRVFFVRRFSIFRFKFVPANCDSI